MAGLFDIFSGKATPEQTQGLLGLAQGLLAASGPSRVPVSFGQALGNGLAGMQQGIDAQSHREREKQMGDLRSQLLGLQVQGAGADLEAQQASRAEAGAINAAAQGAMGPDGQFDQAAFLQNVRRINALKSFELERSLAKAAPEYDTTPQWVNGPDGKPVLMQLSKTAQPRLIDGVSPRDKLEFRDGGGALLGLDAYTGEQKAKLGKSMAPGEAERIGIDRAQLGLSAQRLAMDKANANKATYHADAGGFVLPPTAANPSGKLIPLAGVPGKAPTEFQGKSAAFGLRATEADKVIRELTGKYNPAAVNSKVAVEGWPIVGGMLGAATNTQLSENDQRAEQAQRDFVNAVLRQESGAAIGADEFNNARKQYFPQPGDSSAVIKQKERARALSIQGLQSNAGRAALTAPGAKPAAAPAGGVKFLGFE